jgi:glucose-6-phosphate dehydrogenase assembly protein OpcA
MLGLIEALPIEVVDINWAMLGGWRDLISRVFDTKSQIKNLMGAESVSISYHGSNTRAIYLQGWLVAQLGLKGKVCIEKVENSQVPDGEIVSFFAKLATNEEVTMQRTTKDPKVSIQISFEEKCELPYTIPLLDFSRSLTFMKELFYYPYGEHYKNTLKAIVQDET